MKFVKSGVEALIRDWTEPEIFDASSFLLNHGSSVATMAQSPVLDLMARKTTLHCNPNITWPTSARGYTDDRLACSDDIDERSCFVREYINVEDSASMASPSTLLIAAKERAVYYLPIKARNSMFLNHTHHSKKAITKSWLDERSNRSTRAVYEPETRSSGSTGFCGCCREAANFTALRDSEANVQLLGSWYGGRAHAAHVKCQYRR